MSMAAQFCVANAEAFVYILRQLEQKAVAVGVRICILAARHHPAMALLSCG